MLIGKKIKGLREEKKMSLTELSKKSRVQLATLSRIENLKMTGTLESHMNIAKALGITLTDLYRDIELQEKTPQTAHSEPPGGVFVHSEKSAYEILTTQILSKKMMPMLLKLEVGGKTNTEQNSFGAEKLIYVLEGKIRVYVGKETYTLVKDNSLYFDASLPYYMKNTGKTPARALCVSAPVAL